MELFIAKTNALDPNFSPHAANLPTIATICRQLDGIPLAIEFAAGHAAALGAEDMVKDLRDRMAPLNCIHLHAGIRGHGRFLHRLRPYLLALYIAVTDPTRGSSTLGIQQRRAAGHEQPCHGLP